VVSIRGEAAVTVIVPSPPPASSRRERAIGGDVDFDVSCRDRAKPESSALTTYVPTGSDGKWNEPSVSVTTLRLNPVALFVAVMVTPGSAPLLASVTWPEAIRRWFVRAPVAARER